MTSRSIMPLLCGQSNSVSEPKPKAMTNAEAWQKGNETYKKSFGTKGALTSPPTKKVAVVACMDARVHIEKALGLEEGDAHIIRNAGDSCCTGPCSLPTRCLPL